MFLIHYLQQMLQRERFRYLPYQATCKSLVSYPKPIKRWEGQMVIVEEELKKAYQKMLEKELTVLSMGGWSIYLRHLPDSLKLSLSASVYEGGNFIPKSVRGNLHHKVPFFSPIKTKVNVDEENFRVLLSYVGISENLTLSTFKVLLEEFLQQADWWKLFLDEHDKHDLVYVRVS